MLRPAKLMVPSPDHTAVLEAADAREVDPVGEGSPCGAWVVGGDPEAPISRHRRVLDGEGHRRIVDLMLARSVPHGRQKHEHLVVELKAPRIVLGADEITQIRRYAQAVARDARFNRLKVKWDFVLVRPRWMSSLEVRRVKAIVRRG